MIVLAVYAHPDDPEVSCAGTLARWAQDGHEVHIIIGTLGEKGTVDPDIDPERFAALRAEETAEAAAVLGVASHENLGYPDGEFINSHETRGRLVQRLRSLRPDVVFTSDPTAVLIGDSYVNHHDHRTIGMAVLDACAPAAARPHYFPEAGDPHQVEAIYLSGTLDADTWIDITDTIDLKVQALVCHRSQLGSDAELIDEVVRGRARAAGAQGGVSYAESFRVIRLT